MSRHLHYAALSALELGAILGFGWLVIWVGSVFA